MKRGLRATPPRVSGCDREVQMRAVLAVLTALLLAPTVSATTAPPLTGTWRSAPEELPLTSSFDESVWGKNARSVRTVELAVKPNGDATLIVTRKVLDGRGREVRPATSIEYAELSIGKVQHSTDVRSELAVTVTRAERRYPDDPAGTWALDGLRATVATFADDPSRIEVRVDTPEGRGSFWETLRRSGRK
jgi:hypothetical protein